MASAFHDRNAVTMISRKSVIAASAAIICLVALSWFWLLHSESGARFVWNRVTAATAGALDAGSMRGDFTSGLEIGALTFRNDSVNVEVKSATASVDLNLFPLSVEFVELHVDDILLEFTKVDDEGDEPADIRNVVENLSLPLQFSSPDVRLVNARVAGLLEEKDLVVESVALAMSWKDDIRVERLEVVAPEASAKLSGDIKLLRPFAVSIAAEAELSPVLTGQNSLVLVSADLAGSLDESSVTLVAEQWDAELSAQLHNLLDKVSWNARLNATLEEFGLQPSHISITADGDLSAAKISEFSVDGTDLKAKGNGILRWSDGVEVVAQLEVAEANLAVLTPQWPAAHPVSGNLDLEYSGTRLALSESNLSINGADSTLSVDGEIDLDTKIVAGELTWSALQWPVGVTEPAVSSGIGKVAVSGSIDDWTVNGNVLVAAANVDDGEFTIVGGGSRSAAEVAIVDGSALGGTLSGIATYSWINENAWTAVLDVDGVQTEALLPDWPAILSGHVDASGQREPFQVGVSVRDLEGELFDKPVRANGEIRIADKRLTASNFDFAHGASHIRADGDVYSVAGIDFELSIEDVGDYVAGAAGNFDATGNLSLRDDFPSVNVDATSNWLSYSGFEVFELAISDDRDSADGLDIGLVAKDITFEGEHFRDLNAEAVVLKEKQILGVGVSFRQTNLRLELTGAFDDWNDPTEWAGELSELELVVRDLSAVTLQSPTNLLLDSDRITIDEFCLAESIDEKFCGNAHWVAGELLDVDASFTNVPIDLVNVFQETAFTFDQLLNGQLSWRWAIREQATGKAEITITPGTIRSDDRSDIVVRTETGSIQFNVIGGNLLSGSVHLPMPGTGQISGEFSAKDVAAGLASPVEGGIDVSMNDIAIAAAFTPLIDEAGGQLLAELDFSGVLESPRLVGNVELSAGTISYQPLGTRLEEIELQARLNGDRQVTVEGTFRAGEGVAEFHTSAENLVNGLTNLEIFLKGDNLALINVPDIQATANADLTIGFSKDVLQLGGRLAIPTARIRPTNLGSEGISESGDVIIIAGELPSEEEQEPSKLEIQGELEVTLGPDVVIDLAVAKANVTGLTTFTWTGDPMPIANGRYDITGNIQALGQVLKIEEGGVRFAGVSADSPYIRVRATREIFGNSQVKRAGVLVDGDINRPTVEAYTVPMTTEERALTLLVTGSDFDLEAGAGAIDFGTYIAPKLFVSYGVGIFDRDNVISARYDLKRGFGVKATSGQKDSGVDFIYRYEN
jgi:translocation and assembly module TamB